MKRAAVVAIAGLAGCDDPICQSREFVAIQTSEVSGDTDPDTDGVQATIRVRASIAAGESVTLQIFDASDELLGTTTAPVDADGVAVFSNVTIGNPSRLVASVDGPCSSDSDELSIAVRSGCELGFSPIPAVGGFYAPAGVLDAASDLDPTLPGLQAQIIVDAAPHARVEIFDGDRSFGMFDAGETGHVEASRTLLEGSHSFRAICVVDPSASISERVPLLIDTVAPTCEFTIPAPGTTITRSLDQDNDPTNGIQLEVTIQVFGDDVSNEPTSLVVTELGETPVPFTTVPVDANGNAMASGSVTPGGTFSFAFRVHDHASNECAAVETYVVEP